MRGCTSTFRGCSRTLKTPNSPPLVKSMKQHTSRSFSKKQQKLQQTCKEQKIWCSVISIQDFSNSLRWLLRLTITAQIAELGLWCVTTSPIKPTNVIHKNRSSTHFAARSTRTDCVHYDLLAKAHSYGKRIRWLHSRTRNSKNKPKTCLTRRPSSFLR